MNIRRFRKWCGILLCQLLALMAAALAAGAEGPADRTRAVSLVIDYRVQGQPVSGTTFDLYRVGDVSELGEVALAGDFQNYAVSLAGLDSAGWKELAETLYGYILRDGLAFTDSGATDENGSLKFPARAERLETGLYLAAGRQHSLDGKLFTPEPFLLTLPGKGSDGAYDYDVQTQPKYGTHAEDEPVSCSVLKVWDDGQDKEKRPDSITAELLKNGAVYDTITLSQENNWRYCWEDLDGNARYQVTEKDVPPGYTAAVSQEGGSFVITNTLRLPGSSSPSSSSKLPQTGLLWWPVPLLTIGGLLLFLLGWVRYQRET